ncbi:MAG: sulfotransferase [Cyanobacteriota bacterium]|nr:sulfotransferase [Cyanobacteriota bacterium]
MNSPTASAARLAACRSLAQQGRFAEAEASLAALLAMGPPQAEALALQGALRLAAGDPAAALVALQQAAQLAPPPPPLLGNLALAQLRLGDPAAAAATCRQALAADPHCALAWLNLGLALQEQGDPAAALQAHRRAAALLPHSPEPLSNEAGCLWDLGEPLAAITAARRALAVQPNHAPALLNLGQALMAISQAEPAEAALARGLERIADHDPQRHAALLARLASLNRLGRLEQAEHLAQQSLEATTDNHQKADLLWVLAGQQLIRGEIEAASTGLRQALRLAPHHGNTHLTLAPLRASEERPSALAAAEAALEATPQLRQRLPLAFAAARLAGDLERPDAFSRLLAANNLRCIVDRLPLRLDAAELAAARQQRLGWNAAYAASGSSDCQQRMVFIVGLPRCGSTLVESILACAPSVLDLGEVGWLDQALRATQTPAAAADHYLNHLQAHHGAIEPDRLLSDKNLFNYELCQAISAVFPAARILHLRRNPMAQLLSILQQNFSDYIPWAYRLDALVEQYHHYRCTMAAFEAMTDLPLHTFVYEDLVKDPSGQLPLLVAACGLPWQDAFLRPERSRRAVYTASLTQVRRPIHTGAVGGWRRYAAELRPWAERLEALGYATGLEEP